MLCNQGPHCTGSHVRDIQANHSVEAVALGIYTAWEYMYNMRGQDIKLELECLVYGFDRLNCCSMVLAIVRWDIAVP